MVKAEDMGKTDQPKAPLPAFVSCSPGRDKVRD